MAPVVEGILHSPPRRSKLDASEGQKNRISQEAMVFLESIENELNPEGFTFEEILGEGIVCIFGEGVDASDESNRKKQVNRYLNFLVNKGYIEVIDDETQIYRLASEKLRPAISIDEDESFD